MAAFRRSSRRTTRRRYRPRPRRVIRRRTLRYRRSYRRARVSRRQILNISSIKKSDKRLQFSNLDNTTVAPQLATAVNSSLSGANFYTLPYIVTAQDKSASGGQPALDNYRERTRVFMRGYKENVRFIFSGNAAAWQWRRVCFTIKGDEFTRFTSTSQPLFLETAGNGYVRTVINCTGNSLGNALITQLFKGVQGVDWLDPMAASIDTTRIRLMYDKTRILRGGNGESRVHQINTWFPMNKTFVYDDDESGQTGVTQPLHVDSLQGMGDYYIVDFLQCSNQSSASSGNLYMEGNLYWHER